MKNQAFSIAYLARCLRDIDFYDNELINTKEQKEQFLKRTAQIADNLFDGAISLGTIKLGKKKGYVSKSFSEKLILRRCVENLTHMYNIKYKHRNQITKELSAHLSDGTEYRIYKLDIKSFFESIDTADLKIKLADNDKLSVHTKKLITQYLKLFNEKYGIGLPRGIEISPVLAEIILKEFDQLISTYYEVYYYQRFVDDIVIITTMKENKKDLIQFLASQLKNANPKLNFNICKQKIIDVKRLIKDKLYDPRTNKDETIDFTFLGYKYQINNPWVGKENTKTDKRSVVVGISEKKVKLFKTKIYKSFYSFLQTGDKSLLLDRIRFLSTNRDMISSKNKKIATGIFYNYCMIGHNYKDLLSIDSTLHQLVLSSKGRLNGQLQRVIPPDLREEILKLSFVRGFEKRIFKKYSLNRLSEITKIW